MLCYVLLCYVVVCYGMECIGIDSKKWNMEGDKNE